MTTIRRLPADVFGRVTARMGGSIHYLRVGRLVIAWHVKETTS